MGALVVIVYSLSLISGGVRLGEVAPEFFIISILKEVYVREPALLLCLLLRLFTLRTQEVFYSPLQMAVVAGICLVVVWVAAAQMLSSGSIPNEMIRGWLFVLLSVSLLPLFVKSLVEMEILFSSMTAFLLASVLANFIAAKGVSMDELVNGQFVTSFAISRLSLMLSLAHAWISYRQYKYCKSMGAWQAMAAFSLLCLAFLTGSRLAFVAATSSAVFLVLFLFARGKWKASLISMIAVIVALAVSNAISDRLLTRLTAYSEHASDREYEASVAASHGAVTIDTHQVPWGTCQEQVTSKMHVDIEHFSQEDWESICSNRIVIFDYDHRIRLILKAFRDYPGIVGNGYGSFSSTIWSYGGRVATYKTPHNIVAYLYFSFGPIAVGLFFASLFFCFLVVARGVLERDSSVLFLSGQPLVMTLASLTGGGFFDARWIWLCAMILATTIMVKHKSVTASNRNVSEDH